MWHKKGFTLVELLVVISIIALLMGILMPALNKARQQGQRTVCMSMLNTYGKCNFMYSTNNDGWFVPFSQAGSEDPERLAGHPYWDERWPENDEFRNYLAMEAMTKIEDGGWNDAYIFPKDLRCPSHKIGDVDMYTQEVFDAKEWRVAMSYAMNVERWRGSSIWSDSAWYPDDRQTRAYHISNVKRGSNVMMFIDNNYYQTRYERSNYELYWDKYGDIFKVANLSQTCYRHNEGANLVYFDGHAGYLKKNKIWDKENPVPPFDLSRRKINRLWDMDGYGLKN